MYRSAGGSIQGQICRREHQGTSLFAGEGCTRFIFIHGLFFPRQQISNLPFRNCILNYSRQKIIYHIATSFGFISLLNVQLTMALLSFGSVIVEGFGNTQKKHVSVIKLKMYHLQQPSSKGLRRHNNNIHRICTIHCIGPSEDFNKNN